MAFDPRGFPGYLFDLDGTLIDTAPDIRAAVNHALERYGYGPVSQSMVRHWVGHGGRACIEQAVAAADADGRIANSANAGPAGGDGARGRMEGEAGKSSGSFQAADPAQVDEMLDRFLDHYRAHIADASRPYPRVVEALGELSARGARLAVVTNKRIELTRKLLDELELTVYFDAIVGGDTTPNPKPAPDPILFACREIGLTPADILFVGDSLTDVNGARAAGCAVVCVPNGYNHGIDAEHLGADAIVGSMTELV